MTQTIARTLPIALLSLLLVLLAALPVSPFPVTLMPNMVWVLTLLWQPRGRWPVLLCLLLGLLQDVLSGTPLGAQGLLSVLLYGLCQHYHHRLVSGPFRLRLMEVTGVLVLWHGLLWAILKYTLPHPPLLAPLLLAGLASAGWYALLHRVSGGE